ncbi:hypothetical protein GCM10022225_56490 [Plantactinospora mayteni]|uniref:Recombination endonuclease VII n=1 Tax=Plantactinospora mayteni TaxID=566021 RepID=A0ABQ4EUN0_9ACTN|nr:hypothetical protein Pma05_48870 [Plantactinospora mayteni]
MLPPCVVCGEPVLDGSGWASTLTRAEATALLRNAPPKDRSVIDPKVSQPVWVGHEHCTGNYLRTNEQSAEELEKRLVRRAGLQSEATRQAKAAAGRPVRRRPLPPQPRNASPVRRREFWRDHGLVDGERVDCAVCGRTLRARVFSPTEVAVGVHGKLKGIALICGDCGRLHCVDCAVPGASPRPTCHWCRRPGSVTVPVT